MQMDRDTTAMTDTMNPTTSTLVPVQEVALPITGMTCASCVRRVEKALAKAPGVTSANVNLATERATVSFDPEQASIDQLRAAVEKAGYGVGKIAVETPAQAPIAQATTPNGEATLPIEGMTCASCVRRVERALT